MTSLFARLRSSFGHRNDPPVLLSDCVTREVPVDHRASAPRIEDMRRTWHAAGWKVEDIYPDPTSQHHTVFVLRRYDGELGDTPTTRRGH